MIKSLLYVADSDYSFIGETMIECDHVPQDVYVVTSKSI